MRIRWKILTVVLPLLVVTIVLVGVSAFFSSTTGITHATQDFLDFNAGELQKHAESQWRLVVDNGLFVRTAPVSVGAFERDYTGSGNVGAVARC